MLVAGISAGNRSYGYAMIVLAVAGILGLVAALFLPREMEPAAEDADAPVTAERFSDLETPSGRPA